MTQPDPNELSSQMRNAMMVFVAKFLFVILPPLIGIFFYILTMTKNDVQITIDNKIVEIEQTHQSNIAHMKALHERKEQKYQNKITEMEQVHQSKIAEMGMLKNKIEQTHQSNIAEMKMLKEGINVCKEGCNKENLELKISEKQTVSDRFKMNFNLDKKKMEFKFEEVE